MEDWCNDTGEEKVSRAKKYGKCRGEQKLKREEREERRSTGKRWPFIVLETTLVKAS